MAAILNRLVKQLKDKGKSDKAARAIAVSALQKSGNLKKGSTKATAKGVKQGAKSPSQRAKERAAKYSKGEHIASSYKYDKKTNLATLKKGKK